jgi:hypothetical protein
MFYAFLGVYPALFPGGSVWRRTLRLVTAVVASGFAYLLAVIGVFLARPFENSPSPGLARLAAVVSMFGLLLLLAGAIRHDGDGDRFVKRWLNTLQARAGLDVLFVLSASATIAYMASWFS